MNQLSINNSQDIRDIIKEKENEKEKHVYVLYSGGCDSTLVLNEALTVGPKINTISFVSEQLGARETEAKAREKYLRYCREKNLPIGDNIVINLDNEGSNGFQIGSYACPQAAIWLYNMIAFLPNNSIVLTGYIRGDDFFRYDVLSYWTQAYEGFKGLFDKNIDIYFPLHTTNKDEVIAQLKRLDIEKYTSYCETPDYDGSPCGICESCKKHIAYGYLIERKEPKRRKRTKSINALELKESSVMFTYKSELDPTSYEHSKPTKKSNKKIKHGNI